MTAPFDSTFFFDDEFFSENVTIGTDVVAAVVEEMEFPSGAGGGLDGGNPGDWARVSVMNTDDGILTQPEIESTITRHKDSTIWRVKSVRPSGDCWEMMCIKAERVRK